LFKAVLNDKQARLFVELQACGRGGKSCLNPFRCRRALARRPIAETVSGRNLATSSAQPAVSLLTEKNHPSGSTTTSKLSFDTSTTHKELMAIFVSHPC